MADETILSKDNSAKEYYGTMQEKIDILNKQSKLNTLSYGTKLTKSSISNQSEQILIWGINEKFSIIGESHMHKMDVYNKKNNVDDMCKYIAKIEKSTIIVFTFQRSECSKKYKRSILLHECDYSLNQVFEISEIAKFYLKAIENVSFYFEIPTGFEEITFFLISCVMYYCKFYQSSRIAYQMLKDKKFFDNISINSVTLKHLEHFDYICRNPGSLKIAEILLDQIIISELSTLFSDNGIIPMIRIKSNGSSFKFKDSFYDLNFLIFSKMGLDIFTDTIIELYFTYIEMEYIVFRLEFNTLLYPAGIHRFGKNDLEIFTTPFTNINIIPDKCNLDIILSQIDHGINLNPYIDFKTDMNFLKKLTERIFNDYDEKRVLRLRNLGFNKIIADFCSQMHFDDSKAKELETNFLKGMYNFERSKSQIENVNNPISIVKETRKVVESARPSINGNLKESKAVKPVSIDFSQLYQQENSTNLHALKLIEDPIIEPKPFDKSKFSFMQKAVQNMDGKYTASSYSAKALFLIPIINTKDTFFENANDLNVLIDFDYFENFFCSEAESKANVTTKNYLKASTLSEKRQFLISLAIKSLELNNIQHGNLERMVKETPEKLQSQDLANILRILPEDSSEREKILNKPAFELDPIELTMYKIMNIPNVRNIVNILKFKISFFEDLEIVSKSVLDIHACLSSLLGSEELMRMLKIILEVSNAINMQYSRNRRLANGFKIELLTQFKSYNGKSNKTLIDFLRATFKKNGLNFEAIKSLYNQITLVKNEDLALIKSKINSIIEEYNVCLWDFHSINEDDKSNHSKFLSFVHKELENMKVRYENCIIESYEFKRKLGENEKNNLGIILSIISDFFNNINQ